jgi:hypothetical protein
LKALSVCLKFSWLEKVYEKIKVYFCITSCVNYNSVSGNFYYTLVVCRTIEKCNIEMQLLESVGKILLNWGKE